MSHFSRWRLDSHLFWLYLTRILCAIVRFLSSIYSLKLRLKVFRWTSVRCFGPHQSWITRSHLPHTNRTFFQSLIKADWTELVWKRLKLFKKRLMDISLFLFDEIINLFTLPAVMNWTSAFLAVATGRILFVSPGGFSGGSEEEEGPLPQVAVRGLTDPPRLTSWLL